MTTNKRSEAREQFRELVKRMPRVTYLETAGKCEEFSSARSSVGTYHHPDPEVRAAKQAHAACRNVAHWRFTELKPRDEWDPSQGRTRVVCWSHLLHWGIFSTPRETAATEKWLKHHAPEFAEDGSK